MLNKLSSQIITHAQGKQIAKCFKDFSTMTPKKLLQEAFLDILLRSPLNTSPPWFCKCLKLWFRPIKMITLNLKWLSTRRLGRLCGNTVWTTTDPWDHRENTRLDRTLYLYPIIMIVRVVKLVLLCFQILQIALIFLFWNDWEILWNHAWELTQSWNGLILKWPPSGRWSIWLN